MNFDLGNGEEWVPESDVAQVLADPHVLSQWQGAHFDTYEWDEDEPVAYSEAMHEIAPVERLVEKQIGLNKFQVIRSFRTFTNQPQQEKPVEQLTHTIEDAMRRAAAEMIADENSEIHDPKSPYYDPTLTVESARAGMVRQYTNTPGITDEDRRHAEANSLAGQHLSEYLAGDRPVATVVGFDDFADYVRNDWRIKLSRAGHGENARINETDLIREVNNRLNKALFPKGSGNPAKQWVGIKAVPTAIEDDDMISWNTTSIEARRGNAFRHTADGVPVPVILFAHAGNAVRELTNSEVNAVAYAYVPSTRIHKEVSFIEGQLRETFLTSPFGGTHLGIIKTFKIADCGSDTTVLECPCAKCEAGRLSASVRQLSTTITATEHDPVSDTLADNDGFSLADDSPF